MAYKDTVVDDSNDVTRPMAIIAASTAKQCVIPATAVIPDGSTMGIPDRTLDTTVTTQVVSKPEHHVEKTSKQATPLYRQLIVVLFVLVMGFAMGLGFSRTILDKSVNMYRYCSHGACTSVYDLPCTDWQLLR